MERNPPTAFSVINQSIPELCPLKRPSIVYVYVCKIRVIWKEIHQLLLV